MKDHHWKTIVFLTAVLALVSNNAYPKEVDVRELTKLPIRSLGHYCPSPLIKKQTKIIDTGNVFGRAATRDAAYVAAIRLAKEATDLDRQSFKDICTDSSENIATFTDTQYALNTPDLCAQNSDQSWTCVFRYARKATCCAEK